MTGPIRSWAILLSLLPVGVAQQVGVPTDNLADMPLDELLSLKVTSVGRKAQVLAKAPAAVFVITQEDIRRSGATTLMDVLRMVPGLAVARINGTTWAISARGGTAQFANKMLVLIDGRSVYSQFFSGVVWDQQDVMLEDIDRIEVIRGPGAVMWGANAVNGVINVITSTAAATQGGLVSAGTGTEDRAFGAVRYGGKIGQNAAYRVYAKYNERIDDKDKNESVTDLGVSIARPDPNLWNAGRAGFRVDWDRSRQDSIIFQGDVFGSAFDQMTLIPSLNPPYQTLLQGQEQPFGADIVTRWTRKKSADQEMVLQAYYDHVQADNTLTSYRRDTEDIDFQSRRLLNDAHEFYWGLGYRYSQDRIAQTGYLVLTPFSRGESLYSAVVRDEWQIRPNRWTVSAGLRLEHNDYTGLAVQPSVRLLYTPSRKQSFWAAWSRAVRTPARIDSDLRFLGAVDPSGPVPVGVYSIGNPGLQAEVVRWYEMGYRRQAGQKWSIDVSLFFSQLRSLAAYVPQTPTFLLAPLPHVEVDAREQNDGYGNSSGAEIWGTWNFTPRWRLIPGYALLLSNNGCYNGCVIQPKPLDSRHRFYFRSLFDISRTVQFDAAAYTASRLGQGEVPAYTRIDARLSWRPGRKFEISATLQDMLTPARLEFLPNEPYVGTDVGRSAILRVTHRF